MKTCPLFSRSPLFRVSVKREFTVLASFGMPKYMYVNLPLWRCIFVPYKGVFYGEQNSLSITVQSYIFSLEPLEIVNYRYPGIHTWSSESYSLRYNI